MWSSMGQADAQKDFILRVSSISQFGTFVTAMRAVRVRNFWGEK